MIDNTTLFKARVKMLKNKEALNKAGSSSTHSAVDRYKQDRTKAPQRSSPNFSIFNNEAREVLQNITELRNLVLEKRKGYILCSSTFSTYGEFMTDEDRKKFDIDTDTAIKQCSRLIQCLEKQISADKILREDELKHLKFVARLLNIYLKNVCHIVAMSRYETNLAAAKEEEETKVDRVRKLQREIEDRQDKDEYLDTLGSPTSRVDGWEEATGAFDIKDESVTKFGLQNGTTKHKEVKVEPKFEVDRYIEPIPENEPVEDFDIGVLSIVEQEQLMAENKGLFKRISHSNEEILRIESHLLEIQKLQDTFAEKLVEQDRDIDTIHTHSIETLDNLDIANEYIREAIRNTATRRVIALFCLIVLTFTLLFLDWYNP
ncbi:syntaxin-18 [Ditylenchus destructor]|uniref:Syntaxin-18 n=1 Tax=Ditylenchus destructor TaxID=166010 RepID=A0AAD4QY23_9BILA|nr:syntaxin-18 [Ditylenchus destructor]